MLAAYSVVELPSYITSMLLAALSYVSLVSALLDASI